MEVLSFIDVDKYYGTYRALNKCNLHVESGEIHAILGHNGSGKTTSFLIANGLILPTAGKIRVFGKSIENLTSKDRCSMGLLTEKIKLYREMSVQDILFFFAGIYETNCSSMRIHELLEIFNLKNEAKKKVKCLSTGMHKRLAIAATLVSKPKLAFLDEPFSGLDPISVEEMSSAIHDYNQSDKITFIISSHNLPEIESISSSVTILREGRNMLSGKLIDLFKNYALENSFQLSFLKKDGCRHSSIVRSEGELSRLINYVQIEGGRILSIEKKVISLSEIYHNIYQ